MAVTAKLKYLRIAPRKVRLVADLIKKKRVLEARSLLEFTIKRAAKPIQKLLQSAIANAENNFGMEASNLFISKIFVDEGPTLKRTRARALGRFFPVHKRTSHVTLVLDEIEKRKRPKGKAEKRPSFAKAMEGKEKKKRELKKPQRRPEIKKGLRPAFREKIQRTFRRKAF